MRTPTRALLLAALATTLFALGTPIVVASPPTCDHYDPDDHALEFLVECQIEHFKNCAAPGPDPHPCPPPP